MLQPLGLVVHPIPLHPENFRQHPFDEVMTKRKPMCDFAPRRGQTDLPVALHPYQSVFFQAAKSHSDRGRRHRKPVGKGSRDDSLAFAFSGKNCLQIIFFGNRDHWERLYDLSMVNHRLILATESLAIVSPGWTYNPVCKV